MFACSLLCSMAQKKMTKKKRLTLHTQNGHATLAWGRSSSSGYIIKVPSMPGTYLRPVMWSPCLIIAAGHQHHHRSGAGGSGGREGKKQESRLALVLYSYLLAYWLFDSSTLGAHWRVRCLTCWHSCGSSPIRCIRH